jgi:hypothetical protein
VLLLFYRKESDEKMMVMAEAILILQGNQERKGK